MTNPATIERIYEHSRRDDRCWQVSFAWVITQSLNDHIDELPTSHCFWRFAVAFVGEMKILEIAANQSRANTLVEGIVAGAEPKQIIAAVK